MFSKLRRRYGVAGPLAALALIVSLAFSGVPAMAGPVANVSGGIFGLVKHNLKLGQTANKRSVIANKRSVNAIKLAQGSAGPQGPKGDKGEKGDRGPKGEKGDPGESATALWAVVDYDGSDPTIVRGSGAVGVNVSNFDGDDYFEVTFNQDVSGCSYQATLGAPDDGASPEGTIGVARRDNASGDVYVDTRDTDGVASLKPFHLAVFC